MYPTVFNEMQVQVANVDRHSGIQCDAGSGGGIEIVVESEIGVFSGWGLDIGVSSEPEEDPRVLSVVSHMLFPA